MSDTEQRGPGEFERISAASLPPVDVICSECKTTYQANRYRLFDRIHILGGGKCPACREKERLAIEAQEQATRSLEIAGIRARYRRTCGIPEKFQPEEFGTFKLDKTNSQIRKAYELARQYASEFPEGDNCRGYSSLVLYSTNSWGVGKTHLACSIAHTILNRWQGSPNRCPVLVVSEPELMDRITATYNYTPEEKQIREGESDIIARLLHVPLLVLDDVGKRQVHDPRFVRRVLFAIIDGRYKALLPLVITTNLDVNPDKQRSLAAYLGGEEDQASIDRLIEMTGEYYAFTRMDGPSYRPNKKSFWRFGK